MSNSPAPERAALSPDAAAPTSTEWRRDRLDYGYGAPLPDSERPGLISDAPAALSCLCCGKIGERAVWHEPSGQYVCKTCKQATEVAAPASGGTPPGVAIVQLHEALSWALDILEMNDTRLIQLGDPDYLVRSPVHLAGIAKARAALTAHEPTTIRDALSVPRAPTPGEETP